MALQGYKKYLEYQINKLSKEKVLLYGEIGLKYTVKKDIISRFNVLIYLVIYIVLVWFAHSKNPNHIEWTVVNIILGAVIFVVAILNFSIAEKVKKDYFKSSKVFIKDEDDYEE